MLPKMRGSSPHKPLELNLGGCKIAGRIGGVGAQVLVNRKDLRPCLEMELRMIASLCAKRIFQHARNIDSSEELHSLCLNLKETSTWQQLQRRVPDSGMNPISILAKKYNMRGHIPADMYEVRCPSIAGFAPLNVAGDDLFSLWRYDRHSVPTIGRTESSFSPSSLSFLS